MSGIFKDGIPDEALREGPSVEYVNEVALRELDQSGIRLTADCRITNDHELSSSQIVKLLRAHGWSWPKQWYRQNRNYFQHYAGAAHFEKEVEPGKWIHIVVSPAKKPKAFRWRPLSGEMRFQRADWTRPPRNIELHAESGWLQPSSGTHLWRFLKEKLLRLRK